ncbi:MAG: stage II sporulation protein R [Clostridia bacterium]|nr:stage II sporulation protein R [Clostridia bacterium]
MKIIATILISVATFFTLNAIIPTSEECEIYDSCVRLHILANSNSESDQEVKLKVRDKMLEKISTYEAESKEKALLKIEEDKDELIEIAKTTLEENGFDYDVNIEIGVEDYPTRYYEDFSLPAGSYTSVRVLIGEGAGENWWCVLYPPLCTSSAIKYDDEAYIDVGLTKDQYSLITQSTGKYKIKFKILEVAADAFGVEY